MSKCSEDWLPADLLTKILLKLPAKSIIRFKSVEKCHHFLTHKFIFEHFNTGKKNKRVLVYCRTGTLENHVYVLCLFVDQSLISYQDMFQQLTNPSFDYNNFYSVENGLFCFYDQSDSIITLCNPAIREFRILPQYNENIPPNISGCTNVIGFGLDPMYNDYKVIHIRRFVDKETVKQRQHYALYTMSTDSWKVLRQEDFQLPKLLIIYDNDKNACINGVYYWQTTFEILAFYFSIEVFQFIKLPLPQLIGKLLPFNDYISLWDTEKVDRSNRSNDVWVLNGEGYWTKVLKIEHILEVGSMFGIWKSNMILAQSVTGQLLLYDLETKEFNECGIKSVGYGDFFCVYIYEENLVVIRRN